MVYQLSYDILNDISNKLNYFSPTGFELNNNIFLQLQ